MRKHMFVKGDLVRVFNQTYSGQTIFEGNAQIIKPTDIPDQYEVRFLDDHLNHDSTTYTRFCYFIKGGFLPAAMRKLVDEAKLFA